MIHGSIRLSLNTQIIHPSAHFAMGSIESLSPIPRYLLKMKTPALLYNAIEILNVAILERQ